jgi:hypothetical protein
MAHKVGIRLSNSNSGDTTEQVIEFTENEWLQLQAYLREVKELQATRFAQQDSEVNLNLKWDKNVGITCSVAMPPLDEVLAFLHRMRPLILKREPASFLKVRKMIEQKLKGAGNPLLAFSLELFQGESLEKQVVMKSNDKIINSEKMLFTWLNAHEYHHDHDKQEFLETLHKVLPLEWSRGVFVSFLIDKTKAIFMLASLIELILVLGDREAITVQL